MDAPDVADVVGALVLARTGRRDLARTAGRLRKPYRCCWFDPLHGEASETGRWSYGDATLSVPVCGTCSADLRHHTAPETLVVPTRFDRTTPYYERDDVWARTGYGALVDDLAAAVLEELAERR